MPLYKVQPPTSSSNITQDQPPIFLFPGVLGNMNELKNLVERLYQINGGKNAIYVYQDAKLDDSSVTPTVEQLSLEELSFEELGKRIVIKEMPGVPFHPFPYFLVGHSYGCTIAFFVAGILKALGHQPHLIFLDGPAPDTLLNYFNNDKVSATQDLVSIFKYAAELSSLNPIVFDPEEIKKLAKKTFDNRFNAIIKTYINKHTQPPNENMLQFFRYYEVAKKNLKRVYDERNGPSIVLDKIHLLITRETQTKYHSLLGGWEGYVKSVINITPEDLINQTHSALLTEAEKNKNFNCEKIAAIIHEVFTREVTKEQLFFQELRFYLTKYKENNPEVNVKDILTNIINEEDETNAPTSGKQSPELDQSSPEIRSPAYEIDQVTESPLQLRTPRTEENGAMEIVIDNTAEATSCGKDEFKKKPKKKNQFGLFTDKINNGMETEQNVTSYNTRTQDKRRAQRLQSPPSSQTPSPRSPGSPGSRS